MGNRTTVKPKNNNRNRTHSVSFAGLIPRSPTTSNIARASSKKKHTRCEVVLRKALWAQGLRYRLHTPHLPGRPDLVFIGAQIAVFVDGDFWHGRNLRTRLRNLNRGHNSSYWVNKISNNVRRDRRNTLLLKEAGWDVIRVWETDLYRDKDGTAQSIARIVRKKMGQK